MGKLPVVPYREPEPWVPFGGFSPFRSAEDQERDERLAAEHEELDDDEPADDGETPA